MYFLKAIFRPYNMNDRVKSVLRVKFLEYLLITFRYLSKIYNYIYNYNYFFYNQNYL